MNVKARELTWRAIRRVAPPAEVDRRVSFGEEVLSETLEGGGLEVIGA